jgi:hypothetical protein
METGHKIALGAAALLAALLFGGRSRSRPVRPVTRGLAVGDSLLAHDGAVNVLRQQTRAPWDNVAVVGAGTGAVLRQAQDNLTRPGVYSHVVILAGINDGDRPSDFSKQNLGEIYRLAKAAGAFVIAVTEMPFKGYAAWNQARQDRQMERLGWLIRYRGGDRVDRVVDAWTQFGEPGRPYYLDRRYAAPDGQRHLGALILQAIRL